MKLIIRDFDGTETDITNDLPLQVLWALHRGETKIVAQFIGWSTDIACLSVSTEPKSLMAGQQPGGDAGKISVTLSQKLVARGDALEKYFLPYMTRKERVERGYTR